MLNPRILSIIETSVNFMAKQGNSCCHTCDDCDNHGPDCDCYGQSCDCDRTPCDEK